ncbi:hypothetical protein [Kibdelosporangium aridum]|nr:hypothetical protein [Kibdelosporangium aridum]
MARDDWRAVAELCQTVAADLPRLVSAIADRIRQEIAGYHVVDRTEHERGVTQEYRGLLTGLAMRRPPTQDEIAQARDLAYGEAVRAQDAAQLDLTYRFLDGLITGTSPGSDLTHLAHALNFDPAGTFQAVCSSAVGWTDEDLNTLRGNFRGGRGTMRCANRGTVVVAHCTSTRTPCGTAWPAGTNSPDGTCTPGTGFPPVWSDSTCSRRTVDPHRSGPVRLATAGAAGEPFG